MKIFYSFIIPVFDRPEEIEELLASITKLDFSQQFEVVIIEDGSTLSSKPVAERFRDRLVISYFQKPNTGPGDSRNYGMQRAQGNYFIILDSDVVLPKNYLCIVNQFLNKSFYHCVGGPDTAHPDFSDLQKAINFSMTAFVTTGGIRGRKNAINKFQPRSFNMGLSKEAFLATQGFGNIHPGEDPELIFRLWKLGYKTALIPEAIVFHKRRITWSKFYKQVHKFGLVRPILTHWHPESAKYTYWFPLIFVLIGTLGLLFGLLGNYSILYLYMLYFAFVFVSAIRHYTSLRIAIQVICAVCIQFYGYAVGFLKSTFYVRLLKKNPEIQFASVFFKKNTG